MKILIRIKKKLHKKSGFSLVEMLFSVLILMLSTSVVVGCFSLGVNNFIKVTRASEAQLLCSALTSSIQNELTFAQDIKLNGTKLDSYFSSSRRMGENCSFVVDSGEIKIKKTLVTGSEEYFPLVGAANYEADNRAGVSGGETYFLQAGLEDITWDATNKIFTVKLWVDDAKNTHADAASAKDGALAYSEFSVRPVGTVNN